MSQYEKIRQFLLNKQHTWLITGVAGFIGSNLLEELLNLNQLVIGIDNYATGHKRNLDEVLEVVGAKYAGNFHFYEGDIRNIKDCEKALNNGIDFVLHQAALGSVSRSIENPAATHTVNVTGFVNMLIASEKFRTERFVYASSSSVYGDSPIIPKVETHVGCPLSPYAVTKYADELYAKAFYSCYGAKTVGLRYFNVFGKRQDPNGAYAAVIPLWIKAMLTKGEIFINGDGETTRDFCYIKNAVQANLLAAMSNNSCAINEIYNVSSGQQITLNKLFVTIGEVLQISENFRPIYRDFRAGDIKHSLSDVTKAAELLGYDPTHTLVEGLYDCIEWYKSFL